MINNPFTSRTYESIWLKHFSDEKEETYSFHHINGVKFVKHKRFPFFSNVGKNITNGMRYELDCNTKDFKGKTVLIHDVLDYLQKEQTTSNGIKVKKVPQYKGQYTDLSDVESMNTILQSSFSSKSRSRFRGRIRQIESKFDISQKVYFGEITKEDYLEKMNILKRFIMSRFEQRNIHNNVIPLWDFYVDLIYPLILEKQVVFNVINNGDEPIAMSINFVYDDMVAIAIRSFDIQYFKYNMGNYEIFKLLEWCIDNDVKILDFSKGKADYKDRWSNKEYGFECHIIYDSKSVVSTITATIIANWYRFKQYLRNKGVNLLYTKIKFKLKNLKR